MHSVFCFGRVAGVKPGGNGIVYLSKLFEKPFDKLWFINKLFWLWSLFNQFEWEKFTCERERCWRVEKRLIIFEIFLLVDFFVLFLGSQKFVKIRTCCEFSCCCCCWFIILFCKFMPCGAYADCNRLVRFEYSFDFNLFVSNCPLSCCCCCCAICGGGVMNILSFWDCWGGGGPDINDGYWRNDTIAGSIAVQSDTFPKPNKTPKIRYWLSLRRLFVKFQSHFTYLLSCLDDSVSTLDCPFDRVHRSSYLVGVAVLNGVANCLTTVIVLMDYRRCSWTAEFY